MIARRKTSGKRPTLDVARAIRPAQVPNPRFQEALTASSEQYEKLYPSLAGPTLILNLPFILQAFVGLFKPLFPKTVQDRLKFERAPVLAGLRELTPLTTAPPTRKRFLAEVATLARR